MGDGGGGCWKGECFLAERSEAACPSAVAAERCKSEILSLYASFSDEIESCPSLVNFQNPSAFDLFLFGTFHCFASLFCLV